MASCCLKIVYLCSSVYQPRHGWWQRVWLGIFGSCRFGLGGSDGVSAVWALGLAYSAMLMRGIEVDDPAEVALPKKYLSFCKSFGLVYSILCLTALLESMGLIQI